MTRELEFAEEFIGLGKLNSLKNPDDGRNDPDGKFPRKSQVGSPSTNFQATGFKTKEVYKGGATLGVDLDLKDEGASEYPSNQVKETESGHIIEYDDTFGRERIMLRHRSGSGVEMRADGSIVISSTKNNVNITAADQKVIVEGDAEIVYNGNVKMRVAGDFNLEVGGNFTSNVSGDVDKIIKGALIEDIGKNHDLAIQGNRAETILGTKTETILGNRFATVKGNFENEVMGNMEQIVGDTMTLTAENGIVVSSLDINIAASDLSVFGDSGTIGGANMVYYGHTAHIPRVNSTSVHATAMYATTFHGDLTGKADEANQADHALSAVNASVGSPTGPGTNVNDTTTAADSSTAQPTHVIMYDYLNQTENGIRRIEVDPDDEIKNAVDRSVNYGGVSKFELTTASARSKLRDPNNLRNKTFTGAIMAEGLISKDEFPKPIPKKTGRIASADKAPQRGEGVLGTQDGSNKVFKIEEA